MLAMVVNDNVENLKPRGALQFIASMLAPTEGRNHKPPLPQQRICTQTTSNLVGYQAAKVKPEQLKAQT
jgi:hypothetical protein